MLDQYAASYVPSFVTGNTNASLFGDYVHNIDHVIPRDHNFASDIGVREPNDPEFKELDLNPLTWSQIVGDLGFQQPEQSQSVNLGYMDRSSDFYKNLPKNLQDRIISPDVPIAHGSFTFDADNHAIDALNDLNVAVNEIRNSRIPVDVFEIKKTSIRKTIVHEIGHTLGLAHNFMSNIMPKKGDVPNSIYDKLKEKADDGMTNKSSIMGYPDGRTIVRTKYEDMKPGFNDIERLRYLYKQEYPVYDKNSRGQGSYKWAKLGTDGRILPEVTIDGQRMTPAFLPGCNDIEASYYMNPYCNRHDRGYNAVTLVENYFTLYEDSLYRLLEANIDTLQSTDYFRVERMIWFITSRLLTRSRLFYDYMRLKYEDEISALKDQNGDIFATYDNLLNFSKTCRALKGKSSEELCSLASQRNYSPFIEVDVDGKHQINEFGDLCLATTIYFDRMSKLLETEGKEYTEIDYLDRRVPGGLRSGDTNVDYSQAFGTWKRMTLLPLKFKIMQNVLIPRAMISTRYGDYPLYPYGRPDTSYSLATLFPEEYLNIILQLTKSAMRLENGNEEPRISRSLMYLGYFLRMQQYTADYRLFPSEILDAVVDQTRFRYSGAYIEVDATKEDGTDLAKTFQGTIYNRFNTSGRESLGNIYLYSLDRFIFKSQANSLALPMTPIGWRTPNKGYAAAIKLDYAPNINFEELDAFTPRSFFIDEYKAALERCVEGDDNNGLSSYFKQF
ncbi:MAG: zinc-dependent metalloprotease [Bdellovibrionales bacterium]|nr:zinc-dependent metalloprotease [Bdellovibrionales bacterium]